MQEQMSCKVAPKVSQYFVTSRGKAVFEQCFHIVVHPPATSRDAPCGAQPLGDQIYGAKVIVSHGEAVKTSSEMWDRYPDEFSAVLCAECGTVLAHFIHPSHPNPLHQSNILSRNSHVNRIFFTSLVSLALNL